MVIILDDTGISALRKEYFARVATWFVKRGSKVMLLGDENEWQLCEDIKKQCGQQVYNMSGKWSLKETAAAISLAKMVITNDNGLMHIASALKVPVVAIFGPTLPYKNAPWRNSCRIVRNEIKCVPCYNFREFSCPDGIKCLTELSPEKVIEAIQNLDRQVKCLN